MLIVGTKILPREVMKKRKKKKINSSTICGSRTKTSVVEKIFIWKNRSKYSLLMNFTTLYSIFNWLIDHNCHVFKSKARP